MYQDALNTLMNFFQSGLISAFSVHENGELWITKKSGGIHSFKTMTELLQWFEDNEL